MNINGRRLYSNEEIRQMAIVGFDSEFIEYLREAPEFVRRIVENMLSTENARNELRASYSSGDNNICESGAADLQEANDIIYKQKEFINADEEIDANRVEGNMLEDENPYIDLDFSKRLEINELCVTLTDNEKCDIHNNPFEKCQVVFLYGGGKRYGSYLYCCARCKKLFMREEEFRELAIKLKEKSIKYTVTL